MTTQIRLWLDFAVQIALVLIFSIQIIQSPQDLVHDLALFSLCICAWQISHAWYLVKRYGDWQGAEYLGHLKQVFWYALFTLSLGLFMTLSSFGFLFPFMVFVYWLLYWALCLLLPALALRYFWKNLQRLYAYWYKPRSFWDL
jgi:hypothetical protein